MNKSKFVFNNVCFDHNLIHLFYLNLFIRHLLESVTIQYKFYENKLYILYFHIKKTVLKYRDKRNDANLIIKIVYCQNIY